MRNLLRLALLPILAACANAPELAVEPAPMPSAAIAEDKVLTRIAFGSCLDQTIPMPILETIRAREPDLFVLLGDNVYGDVEDETNPRMPELREAYAALAAVPRFAALRRDIPLMTVWDDHDYGLNDQGGSFPLKEEAEALFEDVWALPQDDERRSRPGVHTSKIFGEPGKRVQVILLDTRYFRDDLRPTDQTGAPGKERYLPKMDPDAQMLGADQEAWLAEELKKPAEIRLVISSIQIIAEGHGWEAWRTLPAARARLMDILDTANGETILISGDRHSGGIYVRGSDEFAERQYIELTASSLNKPASTWREQGGRTDHEPGPHRLGDPVYTENFGELNIDWQSGAVSLAVVGMDGRPLRQISWARGQGVQLIPAAPR
jgi:alkaline phosphatase D